VETHASLLARYDLQKPQLTRNELLIPDKIDETLEWIALKEIGEGPNHTKALGRSSIGIRFPEDDSEDPS